MATQKWPGSAAKMQRRRGKNAGKMWKTGKKMGTPLELCEKLGKRTEKTWGERGKPAKWGEDQAH